MNIQYTREDALSLEEFCNVLESSTLGERRPTDKSTLQGMLDHANLIICARDEGKLIGVSRALSDFNFCTYLSDLAVDQNYQKKGIGKELIRQTHLASGQKGKLILLSAPGARSYYPHIGMEKHDSCWTIGKNT